MKKQLVSAKVAKVLPKNLKIDVNPTYEGVTQNDVDGSLLLLSYVQLVYLKVAELLEYLSSYGVSICLGIAQVTHEDVLDYKRNSKKSIRSDKYIIQDIFFKYLCAFFHETGKKAPSALTLYVVTSFMGWFRNHDMLGWDECIYTKFLNVVDMHISTTCLNNWFKSSLQIWYETPAKGDTLYIKRRPASRVKGQPRFFTF